MLKYSPQIIKKRRCVDREPLEQPRFKPGELPFGSARLAAGANVVLDIGAQRMTAAVLSV